MIGMVSGAMQALKIGDPADLETDVGPVIDEEAKDALDAHLDWLEANGRRVVRLALPEQPPTAASLPPRSTKSARSAN